MSAKSQSGEMEMGARGERGPNGDAHDGTAGRGAAWVLRGGGRGLQAKMKKETPRGKEDGRGNTGQGATEGRMEGRGGAGTRLGDTQASRGGEAGGDARDADETARRAGRAYRAQAGRGGGRSAGRTAAGWRRVTVPQAASTPTTPPHASSRVGPPLLRPDKEFSRPVLGIKWGNLG